MIRIKRNFLSIFFRRLPRAIFILSLSFIAASLIIFTTYAPDVYVFLKWVWKDNIARDIGLHSVTNNNVLFDLSTIIFDSLYIQGAVNYLIAITVIYLIVFYLKYFHFLADVKISRILLVFVVSLTTYDINQLRFQLSLLFLLYSFIGPISRKKRLLLRVLSFFTHLLPVMVFYTSRLAYLPILFLPGLIAMMGVFDSRFSLYFVTVDFIPFKVFLLIIPNLLSIWYYRKKHQRNQIAELAISFTVLAVIFLPFYGLIAARFIEAGFLLFVLWFSLCNYNSKVVTGTLWFFALAMLASRLINSVNAGDNSFFDIVDQL